MRVWMKAPRAGRVTIERRRRVLRSVHVPRSRIVRVSVPGVGPVRARIGDRFSVVCHA
jgi:hypothetical protein